MRNEQGGFVTIFHKPILQPESQNVPDKVPDLNERQKKTIEYVKEHGKITNAKYQELFNVSDSTALRDLNNMVKIDVFEKIGTFKDAYYQFKE